MKPSIFTPNIQFFGRSGLIFFVSGLLASGIIPDSRSQAGDALREADRDFERMERIINEEFLNVDQEWEAQVREQREEWGRLRREVEALWEEYVPSNPVRWVVHSNSKEARSRVDFKKGQITIEALAEENQPPESARREIQRKIGTRLNGILQSKEGEKSPLQGQLEERPGTLVTSQTAERYAHQQVFPKVRVNPKPRMSRDGKYRYRGTVTISLIPHHLKKRAQQYTYQVRNIAERHGLNPARVMAIMHTESAFNPMAVSPVPAYGLMQLVPRTGAHDAYLHLYGKKRILPASYLYNPEKNIRLGTTYFMLVKKNYLRNIQREPHNTYLAMASYNWGIGNIRRSILRRYDMHTLDGNQLLQIIDRRAPNETRNYVKKINKRIELYDSFFPSK